jgi:hypothetical protein
MTSFAFILGCVPLALASGAGAISRQVMGGAVIGGMLAATCDRGDLHRGKDQPADKPAAPGVLCVVP